MKISVVLNGVSNQLNEQLQQLNHFLNEHFYSYNDIEAWILCEKEQDIEKLQFTTQINHVRIIHTPTLSHEEQLLNSLFETQQQIHSDLLVFPSSLWSPGIAVRLAYKTQGSSLINVRSCQVFKDSLIAEKNVYSNNLTAKFKLNQKPYCISLSKGLNETDKLEYGSPVVTKTTQIKSSNYQTKLPWLKNFDISPREKTDHLSQQQIIVVAGRGVGSKEGIEKAEELANQLNGALGATRPVVMNAWTDMSKLIGASGEIVSPKICITIGVSGSAAFLVGIDQSDFIVSINKDKDAPIFDVSDIAITADYQDVVDELLHILKDEIQT